jgi:hypothetical protein
MVVKAGAWYDRKFARKGRRSGSSSLSVVFPLPRRFRDHAAGIECQQHPPSSQHPVAVVVAL